MKRIVTLSVAAAIALSVGGLAGRATAQSPARAPSLAVTLGFIRDKIAEQGRLAYASTTRDSANGQTWDNQFTVEASNAARDDGDCSVGFHWRSTVDGKPAQDLDVHIPFKIVTSVVHLQHGRRRRPTERRRRPLWLGHADSPSDLGAPAPQE